MKDDMSHTTILSKNYAIPKVIVGCWQLAGGHGAIDRDTAIENFYKFYQAGLNTYDCADIYTGVEELLGEYIKKYKSDFDSNLPVQIHTKFVPDLNMLPNMTMEYVEGVIDRSLFRLGVERLDLVQYHWWDYSVSGYVETAQMLKTLQQKGKIRNLGVTNFDSERLSEMIDSGVHFVSNQIQYSVIDSRPEYKMKEFLEEKDMYAICYGTVAGGLLSNKYLGAVEPVEPYENRSLTKYMLILKEYMNSWDEFQNILQILNQVAQKHSVDIATVASGYILSQKRVAAAVIGARSSEHLQSMKQLLSLRLDAEDLQLVRDATVHFKKPSDLRIYGLERDKSSVHAGIMKYNLNKD